jgi:hypothetical protein
MHNLYITTHTYGNTMKYTNLLVTITKKVEIETEVEEYVIFHAQS